MDFQIVSTADHVHGTLQHAIAIARALSMLGRKVRFINVAARTLAHVAVSLERDGIELASSGGGQLPEANKTVIVGLWQDQCLDAAHQVASSDYRFILVPTVYWNADRLTGLARPADALWCVSLDQAMQVGDYRSVATTIEIVRCAVDTDYYKPLPKEPSGYPWIMSRHSRDHPDKFSHDTTLIPYLMATSHPALYRMLGATETLGHIRDNQIETWAEGSLEPREFLQRSDLWVYSHATHWQETACISMLEAMACGLPVLVSNAGGMREYVQHGHTGLMCNDAHEFVRAAQLLFDWPELYNNLAQQARAAVLSRYSIHSMVEQLAALK